MKPDEMIDRYVGAVGQHLPAKTRSDIQLELRSLLQDTLEERAAVSGTEPDDIMVGKVLLEFGKPSEFAARYRPERYLIGPSLYPLFRTVMGVMLVLVSLAFLLGLAATLVSNGTAGLTGQIEETLLEYGQSLVFNLGMVVVVFALVERYRPESIGAKEKEWDPFSLAKMEAANGIKRGELIFGIVWGIFLIVLINFFPEYIGTIRFTGNGREVDSLLTPAFQIYVPWLTSLLVMQVILRSAVLREGVWRPVTRVVELALGLISVGLIVRIFTGPAIASTPANDITARGLVAIVLLVGAVEAWQQLKYLLFKRPSPSESDLRSRIA